MRNRERDRAITCSRSGRPELLDELCNVRLHEPSPRTVRMDHDADQHDHALALALAASSARAPTVVGRSEHHLGSDPMVGSVGMFGVPGYGDRL